MAQKIGRADIFKDICLHVLLHLVAMTLADPAAAITPAAFRIPAMMMIMIPTMLMTIRPIMLIIIMATMVLILAISLGAHDLFQFVFGELKNF
ncbi:hypothetical protein KSX_03370 [Ktedonospora formicarum]|uniref:Uncharacterized protein n=1 Tax=Ktedonospora formicarum TaxID=2778364 RepID=A0A8J3HZK8_9CHLR|nr:hypothetical protein KSX_03370 [Ktedonospora formicarum]